MTARQTQIDHRQSHSPFVPHPWFAFPGIIPRREHVVTIVRRAVIKGHHSCRDGSLSAHRPVRRALEYRLRVRPDLDSTGDAEIGEPHEGALRSQTAPHSGPSKRFTANQKSTCKGCPFEESKRRIAAQRQYCSTRSFSYNRRGRLKAIDVRAVERPEHVSE